MKKLWAPWRLEYVGKDDAGPCVFCLEDDPAQDAARRVLLRGRHSFVIMNRYPYSNGHLLVVPYRHLDMPADFTAEEVLEVHQLMVLCQSLLREACAAQGFNIGWNIGRVAGAGITDHLHLHVVPRWSGDTNYLPVLADVRVIPQHLDDTYALLKQTLERQQQAADALCNSDNFHL
ncbi:MAG: HIT domain-containing protein [Desulfuromonadales bacterium]|nr:HIT domain-containing protein [Desulfuromonadales bacterium]